MREIFKNKSFIAFLILFFAFIVYSAIVILFINPITNIDIKCILAVKKYCDFLPLPLIVAITDFGFSSYFIQFLIPLFIACLYLKRYITFILITGSYLLVVPFIQVVKNIIMRDRPDVHLQRIAETEFSYPSGHSTTAFFMGILLLYLTTTYVKNIIIKRILFTIIIIWMITIPFTRIWLGVHFPTDTVGGALLGASLACLTISMIKGFEYLSKRQTV